MSKRFRILLIALSLAGVVLIAFGVVGRTIKTGGDPTEFAVRAFQTVGVPGASAAYRTAGGAVLVAAVGMDGDGRFPIASVSKPISAVAVLQLVDDGLIGLDDSVFDILGPNPSAGDITIRQLLAHASGISTRDGLVYTTEDVRAEEFALLSGLKLESEPGTTYAYSNLNYRILGVIVEEVTGRGFPDYLTQGIFAPLGMDQTGAGGAPSSAAGSGTRAGSTAEGGLVPGYTQVFGIPVPFFWEAGMQEIASGGIVSTRSDLIAFADALLRAYAGDADTLRQLGLDSGIMEEMWSPVVAVSDSESRGLGWQINDVEGVRIVSHGGDLPGYQALLTIAPDEDRAMVVLGNANTIPLAVAGEIIQETLRSWVAVGGPPAADVRLPRVRMAVLGLILLIAVLMIREMAKFVALMRHTTEPPKGGSLIFGLLGALAPAAVAGFVTAQGILDDALVMLPDITGVLLLLALFGIARAVGIILRARKRVIRVVS